MPNNEDDVCGGGGVATNLPNGDIPGRTSYTNKGGSSCSLHLLQQQQQRNRHSSLGANLSLGDDDVFEDGSSAGGDMSTESGEFYQRTRFS